MCKQTRVKRHYLLQICYFPLLQASPSNSLNNCYAFRLLITLQTNKHSVFSLVSMLSIFTCIFFYNWIGMLVMWYLLWHYYWDQFLKGYVDVRWASAQPVRRDAGWSLDGGRFIHSKHRHRQRLAVFPQTLVQMSIRFHNWRSSTGEIVNLSQRGDDGVRLLAFGSCLGCLQSSCGFSTLNFGLHVGFLCVTMFLQKLVKRKPTTTNSTT